MFNFLDKIKSSPIMYRQLAIDDQLITEFNCPLDTQKEAMWTTHGYFVYVIEGKKVWHVPGKAFELTEGKCVFVKKGAHIVEQFFDTRFCVVVFFVSDRFIVDTLRSSELQEISAFVSDNGLAIAPVYADDALHAFFNSVVPYFLDNKETNRNLLELKFKELILNVFNNPRNTEARAFFQSLLTDTHAEVMRKIMEENYNYNLGLEAFAKMCGRSLSAFKRDFEKYFDTTPGRWLLNRRLNQAQLLLKTSDKSISEIAFDCGFENISHFSRTFKEQQGTSPANFRQLRTKTF